MNTSSWLGPASKSEWCLCRGGVGVSLFCLISSCYPSFSLPQPPPHSKCSGFSQQCTHKIMDESRFYTQKVHGSPCGRRGSRVGKGPVYWSINHGRHIWPSRRGAWGQGSLLGLRSSAAPLFAGPLISPPKAETTSNNHDVGEGLAAWMTQPLLERKNVLEILPCSKWFSYWRQMGVWQGRKKRSFQIIQMI